MTILDEIFAHKSREVANRKKALPLQEVRAQADQSPEPLDFVQALRRNQGPKPALIAEVKRASPSRGLIAAEFDPLNLARLYQENGASAISVLTDERYFLGSLESLCQIAVLELGVPLLRKDFILDPYQVYESRAAGADAILLIAACLDDTLLKDLHSLSRALGMAALVEVHTREELERVLPLLNPDLVGINNRNLHDFSVDLDTTLRLRPMIPEEVCVVAESGIHGEEDLERLASAHVDAILVGEALVAAADTASMVKRLAR